VRLIFRKVTTAPSPSGGWALDAPPFAPYRLNATGKDQNKHWLLGIKTNTLICSGRIVQAELVFPADNRQTW